MSHPRSHRRRGVLGARERRRGPPLREHLRPRDDRAARLFPDRDADFRAVLEEAPRDAHGRARDRVDEADVGVVDRGLGYVFFLRGTRRAGEKKGE